MILNTFEGFYNISKYVGYFGRFHDILKKFKVFNGFQNILRDFTILTKTLNYMKGNLEDFMGLHELGFSFVY